MKRRQTNLLDLTPRRADGLCWEQDETGAVTLLRQNGGFWNRLARLLYAAPRQTRVQLDEMGSFIWMRLDGRQTVEAVARAVQARYAQAAEPLYPRLAQYLRILQQNGMVVL